MEILIKEKRLSEFLISHLSKPFWVNYDPLIILYVVRVGCLSSHKQQFSNDTTKILLLLNFTRQPSRNLLLNEKQY